MDFREGSEHLRRTPSDFNYVDGFQRRIPDFRVEKCVPENSYIGSYVFAEKGNWNFLIRLCIVGRIQLYNTFFFFKSF